MILLSSLSMAEASIGDFVTTWHTAIVNDTIKIPVTGAGTGTYAISWGDGSSNDYTGVGDRIHTYAVTDDHQVRISDDFTAMSLRGDTTNAEKLRSINQWGDARWSTMEDAFYNVYHMTSNATDTPDLSHVTVMTSMFRDAQAFNGDTSGWNTSSVTRMDNMFYNAFTLTGDLSHWDISNVTDMDYMLAHTYAFNGDLSGRDVSNVYYMDLMFNGAKAFNGDLSGRDASNVVSLNHMFNSANSFYQNLGAWYITLDSTHVADGSCSASIGVQNYILDGHAPSYSLVSGAGCTDNGKFALTGNILIIKSAPTQDAYSICIKASDSSLFGTGNARQITLHAS